MKIPLTLDRDTQEIKQYLKNMNPQKFPECLKVLISKFRLLFQCILLSGKIFEFHDLSKITNFHSLITKNLRGLEQMSIHRSFGPSFNIKINIMKYAVHPMILRLKIVKDSNFTFFLIGTDTYDKDFSS